MDISIYFIVMVKTSLFGGVPSITNINAVRVLQVAKMKQESCHYHAPNGANIQVREILDKIKGDAKHNQVSTRNLINEAVTTVPLVVAAQLPSQSLISRTIRRRFEPNLNPSSFMIDFEQPFILAFKDVFPNAEIKGCFFHFQQCTWRKIQENGLQNMYAEDAELSLQIRHLCALAFVPMDKSV
ncbi:hypothetical protein QTP88_028637 [Uroleucon formosanum]